MIHFKNTNIKVVTAFIKISFWQIFEYSFYKFFFMSFFLLVKFLRPNNNRIQTKIFNILRLQHYFGIQYIKVYFYFSNFIVVTFKIYINLNTILYVFI